MSDHFSIKSGSVHLWRVPLADLFSEVYELFALLSPDEQERAERFKFEKHRMRYIVARGKFRQVLGLYTERSPAEIIISYHEHGKPYLADSVLKFNVSHSGEMALFALADQEIGVDIEKVKEPFKVDVAKKYFSEVEFNALAELPENERARAFYSLWSQKEAVAKLSGEGIFLLEKKNTASNCWVKNVFVHADYEAAVATDKTITLTHYFEWNSQGYLSLPQF